VQEIHIQIVGLQPAQAVFTGAAHRRAAGMPGIDFGDQHHPVAQAADRLAHHLLRPAVGIHFRRIDHRQSMVDARAQCSHFLLTLRRVSPIYQVPSPMAGTAACSPKRTVFFTISPP
jgi:hypothetical protein